MLLCERLGVVNLAENVREDLNVAEDALKYNPTWLARESDILGGVAIHCTMKEFGSGTGRGEQTELWFSCASAWALQPRKLMPGAAQRTHFTGKTGLLAEVGVRDPVNDVPTALIVFYGLDQRFLSEDVPKRRNF